MNTGPISDRAGAGQADRPRGRAFSQELARAERKKWPRRPGGAVVGRAGAGGGPAGMRRSLAAMRSAPREVLLRRRGEADVKDDRLLELRGRDRSAQFEAERGAVAVESEVRLDPPTAARLAAAVERIELALERQDRARGPSLEMRLGSALRVQLTRGGKGLELAVSGDAATARLVRAELPDLLAKLRQRGIEVSRAEVRAMSRAPNRGRAQGDGLVDGGPGVR